MPCSWDGDERRSLCSPDGHICEQPIFLGLAQEWPGGVGTEIAEGPLTTKYFPHSILYVSEIPPPLRNGIPLSVEFLVPSSPNCAS